MIQFLLNEQIVSIDKEKPDLTLLDYIRQNQLLCGTKEGCASGDCGACTVAIVELNKDESGLTYQAINSCITYLGSIHGKQLITVEHLATEKALHPVQQAMVDHHASQCGFCTPGFVMSMFSLYHQDIPINHQNVEIALSGNLCRCTGYRPIIDATLQSCSSRTSDKFDTNSHRTIETLKSFKQHNGEVEGYLQPSTREQLQKALNSFPDGRLVCGSTDLALETTQFLKDIPTLINLKTVAELNELEEQETGLLIGAALSFSELEPSLLTHFPDLKELLWRFASIPIRNQASLGGNVANASPIGDMPPVLLALHANINVDNGSERRTIPASEFFVDYRKTKLAKEEWIESIFIPYLSIDNAIKAYKVSKRMEDDISAVCAVFNIETQNNIIIKLTTGFGGVAAKPIQATLLEETVVGLDWTQKSSMEVGRQILSELFSPIDDVRATAGYRNKLIANLWQRFWLETNPMMITTKTRATNYA